MSSRFGAILIAILIVSSAAIAGIGTSSATPANTSASATIQVTAADDKISGGDSTTYTIEVSNTGSSQQTFIIDPTNVPDGWSVDDGEWDLNSKITVTVDAWSSTTVEYTVTGGSTSEYQDVSFGVWTQDCGILGCGKGTQLDTGSDGVTVDARGPFITNVGASIDGREVTIEADVSDNTGVDSVEATYDTGVLDLGGDTIDLTHESGNRYTGSFTLDWGASFSYHVSTTDTFGQSNSSPTREDQIQKNDVPSITNIRTSADGVDVTVRADITDRHGIDSAELTYSSGWFSGSKTVSLTHESGDTYSATLSLDWGQSVSGDITATDPYGASSSSGFTAAAESDDDGPSISDVAVDYDGKTVIVTADVADGTSGVASDSVNVHYDTGLFDFFGTTVEMTPQGGDIYRGTFELSYGQRFQYKVSADDNAENQYETPLTDGRVPRGTATIQIANNDDESKSVEVLVDGTQQKTVDVPAGGQTDTSLTVDPVTHTFKIRYTEQDHGQTYSQANTAVIPQSASKQVGFDIPERRASEIALSCANSCDFGTYNPEEERPTLRLNVENTGGQPLDWQVSSAPVEVVETGSDYLVVRPYEGEAGTFQRSVTVLNMNERYEGDGSASVELTGQATIEPEPPSVDISSYPTKMRAGVEAPYFTAFVENGAAGTSDQPEPAAPEDHIVTWYIDGEQVAQSTPDKQQDPGALDRATLTADGSGMQTVRVVAKDPNTGKTASDSVEVEVTTVDGKITGYTSPTAGSEYELDRWYEVGVRVKNTGGIRHTFAVEAPGHSGLETQTERKTITLDPGATGVVTFQQRFYGTYTSTRTFTHKLIDDVDTDQSSEVIDESTLQLSEPANGEILLKPNTGDGEPAMIDVKLTDVNSGEVIEDQRISTDGTNVEGKQYDVPTGTYELTVNADGYRSRTTEVTIQEDTRRVAEPLLAPKGVEATIVDGSFSVDRGVYQIGDNVGGTVTVRNTGEKTWEFFVGYSVRPNGTDLIYSQEGQTGNFVELAPGEQENVSVEWRVDETVQGGSYDAVAAVWYGYPEDGADKIEGTGWQPNQFTVSNEARTRTVTYQGTTYQVQFRSDNTITVFDQNRELVTSDRASAVLDYMAFKNYSVDNPSDGLWKMVNASRELETYYWASHLNQAGITAFKAYVNVHFGSYQDGMGEYIDLTTQATRLMKEQGSTAEIGSTLHNFSKLSAETYKMYDSGQKVDQYASMVLDAYRIKQATEGAETMSDAVDIARKTDAADDLSTSFRDMAISQAMRPLTDVNAGLKITSQQALLASHWGKTSKPLLQMLENLEEKRQAGTITEDEMRLYYLLQVRFWGSSAMMWDRMATLQAQGERASTAFAVISDVNGNNPQEFRSSAHGLQNLTDLKMELMGEYLNRSENLRNHSVNIHETPETSALSSGEPLVVSSPGWVEPGEEATIHVTSRGDPVINAEVTVGESVVETDRNGNATVRLWDRGNYRATIVKDGFETAETVFIVREPKVATRSFPDVTIPELRNDETVTMETTFNNSGETTLEVTDVSADHPGVSATVSQAVAEPGENLSIGVTVDAADFETGSFSTNVTVDWAGVDGTTEFLVSGNRVTTIGTLRVETTPTDATVWIDDSTAQTAPVETELPTGKHTVTVNADGYQPTTRTVTVSASEQTTTSVSLTEQNAPPQVTVSATPPAPTVGDSITVTAEASDPDGDALTYEWDTDDDGAYDDASGSETTVTFEASGEYPIRVRVDDGSTTITDSLSLSVSDSAPALETFNLTTVGTDGLELRVDASTELATLNVTLAQDDTTIGEFNKSAFYMENGEYVLSADNLPPGTFTAYLDAATTTSGTTVPTDYADTATIQAYDREPDATIQFTGDQLQIPTGDTALQGSSSLPAGDSLTVQITADDGTFSQQHDATVTETGTFTVPLDLPARTAGTPVNVSIRHSEHGQLTLVTNATVIDTYRDQPVLNLTITDPTAETPATVQQTNTTALTITTSIQVREDLTQTELQRALQELQDGSVPITATIGGEPAPVQDITLLELSTTVDAGTTLPVELRVTPPSLAAGEYDAAVSMQLPNPCWPKNTDDGCPTVVTELSDDTPNAVHYETGQAGQLTATDAVGEPGGTATVEFSLMNTDSTAQAYIIRLQSLPENVTISNHTTAGGTWQDDGTWLFQTVEANESRTPTVELAIPTNASEEFTITAELLTNEAVIDTTTANVTTETPLPVAVDNDNNGRIGDFEVLTAIEHWRNQEPVSGTANKVIGDFQILDLIEMWRDQIPVTEGVGANA